MKYKNSFSRYELKYLITETQYIEFFKFMKNKMVPDEYGKTFIRNIYFDTPNCLLIRRSIDKPIYKEKLRLRTYGNASDKSIYFFELKKKYDAKVYKRRVKVDEPFEDVKKYNFMTNQTGRELSFAISRYGNLQPSIYLSYEREAFVLTENNDYRITFDRNITWRNYDLSLLSPPGGNKLLAEDQVLMELKISASIPLWLVSYFSQHNIYKTSFSKYGAVYSFIKQNSFEQKNKKALFELKGEPAYV